MTAKGIACLTLILITILTTQKLFAADYAVAAPTFIDGKCAVAVWMAKVKVKELSIPAITLTIFVM